MSNRRHVIALLGGSLATWPLRVSAQQSGKLPLVGVLVSASPPHRFADTFKRGLQTLGYSEGRNIALEFRYSEGRSMGVTQTIPIVMAPAGAPLQSGFIDSLAHPGGNVTGLSAMEAEIGGKRLQLLRDLIPSVDRIAVLASTTATDPFSGPYVENLRLAATRIGLQLEPVLINGPNRFEGAFAAMAKANAKAVIIQPLFDPHRAVLVELATKHRLALMSGSRETIAAGGVISISANFPLLYERSAVCR
jgi:putative tryptophan/tyrosine transport system substrate-binding protein